MKYCEAAALFIVLLLSVHTAHAAPKADLWDRWLEHDARSATPVDHKAWSSFLERYVTEGADGINRVNYEGVTRDDLAALQGYLDSLSKVSISRLNRNEQKAYWVNLYNALTVKVILDNYPVKSIRDIDISPGWFSDGPWGKKLISVEGIPVSLDDIEHRILRPIWKDPRVHYAVNCASIGCPNLQTIAFTAGNSEELLEKGAGEYVNHPRGTSISGGKLKVSSIYRWFASDFGGTDRNVIEHLMKYASGDLRSQLNGLNRISDDDYDWSLNEILQQ